MTFQFLHQIPLLAITHLMLIQLALQLRLVLGGAALLIFLRCQRLALLVAVDLEWLKK